MTPNELLQTIQQAKVEGWKQLDLSDQGLTELPDAIGVLTALETLDLSGNELTELPGAIGELCGLRSLVLVRWDEEQVEWRGNQLSQLPPEIGQLSQLTELDLRYNLLSQLPPEIGQLSQLSWLNLSSNQLSQLPPEIGQLSQLSWLNLSSNQLSQLPPEIGQLSQLSWLDLSYNVLIRLPPEIGQLSQLSWLDLRYNALIQLPSEIGQLSQLSRLVLYKNPLSQLPPEIGQLSQLNELYLNGNQLTRLPSEIGQLCQLIYLDLSFNPLNQLPSEIGQLANLEILDLEKLPLTDLPPEIRQLKKLEKLDLRDTPLQIPPELLGDEWDDLGNPAEILQFYFEGTKKPLNEAKLLVVGQGSVGKTSLVNRLLRDRFNPRENKTQGIQIQQWPVNDIQLNVWDFGGQEIMHATHQFFLTQRSLYLLVMDTRLGEAENRLDYWLKIIQSFGGDSPIIVVGNKSDQQALSLDRRGLQLKYPHIKAFVETSCQTGYGIDDLKAAITQEVDQLAHVKDLLPQSWFDLKAQLEDMERDYLSYAEYQQLCQDNRIDDERDQQLLVGFLHDLGVVLNFRDDPRLEDTHILTPVWVTNGVYQILNDNALMTEHKGMLERTMLDRILDGKRYPRHKQLFVIDMMRKFEICFDLVPDQIFLIPDLLSKEEPDTGYWGDALAFQYHYNVLPGSIISRFIVRTHQMISKKTYWRSGVVLSHESNRALVKADREDKKIVTVHGKLGSG